jgi:membrane fusion protein, copper/silver efflux system
MKDIGFIKTGLKVFGEINFRVLPILFLFFFSCSQKVDHSHDEQEKKIYTCPMHPQIISEKPGSCPICGMDLVPVNKGKAERQEIMLNPSQIQLANIKTEVVTKGSIGAGKSLTGRLVADQDQTEVVSSRVEGRIEKLFIKEIGEQVKKGQLLYQIYSEQLLTLQNEYLLAYQQAKEFKDNKRYAAFFSSAEKKLLLLGMTSHQLESMIASKTVSSRVDYYAPYSGAVGEILVAEGQYVKEGELLYRLENLDKIWVEAELYSRETGLVKQGQDVTVVVNGFENEPKKAKVNFLSPEFRKGVIYNSETQTQSVPISAVIRDQQGNHVWVEVKEGIFRPKMVETGIEDFEKIEIKSGLDERENVVVSGAYLLYSEFVLKKGANPFDHQHDKEM